MAIFLLAATFSQLNVTKPGSGALHTECWVS